MFTKIFLFCLAVTRLRVTANPILQALFNQNCQACPQNAPRNQYQAMPLNLQQPTNNIQSYPQAFMVQNGVPYPQGVSPECQMPCPICQPQCKQNQNNQMNSNLFNKIMSNPNLRNILDPNTRLYNQNGAEIPRNVPCNNVVPNVVNNYIIVPPEFLLEDVNFNVQDSRRKEERTQKRRGQGGGRKRPNGASGRDGNSRAKTSGTKGGKKLSDREEATVHISESNIENCRDKKERKPRRRNKNNDQAIQVNVVNENVTATNLNLTESQQTIPQEKSNESLKNSSGGLVANKKLTVDLKGVTKDAKFDKDYVPELSNSKLEEPKAELGKNRNSEQNVQCEPHNTFSETKENTEKPERKNTHRHRSSNSYRTKAKINSIVVKNDREEAAIQDFRHKFPNIPEEVIRDLLKHMKKQLEKQQLGVPTFYYPQLPLSYDQFYYTQTTSPSPKNTRVKTKNGRGRNNRRKQKKKPQESQLNTNSDQCDTLQQPPLSTDINELTTTPIATEIPIVETTQPTKLTVTTGIVTKINSFDTTTAKIDEKSDEIRNINQEDNRENLPDLGSEDVIPVMYLNDLLDDYYPDFSNDNQYYSNEDYSVKFLQDDRYHYTTDKNIEFEELNRERRKLESNQLINESKLKHPENRYYFRFNRPRNRWISRPRIENTTNKSKVKVTIDNEEFNSPRIVEVTTIKPLSSLKAMPKDTNHQEEALENDLQFRTPPTLETIDFETKQINKDTYYYHDDLPLTEKSSAYSDAKTPQYITKEKGDKCKTKLKPKDEIETVYAKSKVVTYGRPNSEENLLANESGGMIERDEDISQYIDNDKTIVLAKTVSGSYW